MLLISKAYWLGMPFNYRGALPAGSDCEPVHLQAPDYRWCHGLMYRPAPGKRTKVGVLVMHPRADFTRHYCIPPFLAAGIAVLGLQTRCINNDVNALHEELILDVAAGVRALRDAGCDQVVLFGNSGGGSLFAFYQAQAQLAPDQRLAHDPAGRPTKLAQADMPPADALLAVSAHCGEGQVLQGGIDPAVVDEHDPLETDPSLDMYHPDNGFSKPPTPSHYSDSFIQRFREAQHDRVARLDAMARDDLAQRQEAMDAYKKGKGTLHFAQRQMLGRRAAFEPVMTIYRTMANPKYTDLSLDPSARSYGSLLSERPDLMNYKLIGFGRLVTPEAWLSTWSGQSSNADFCANAQQLTCPVMMVNALRDKEIHPADAARMWASLDRPGNTFLEMDAEHYFEPEFGAKTAPDVDALMARVIDWVFDVLR